MKAAALGGAGDIERVFPDTIDVARSAGEDRTSLRPRVEKFDE